jgi:hypothetical protein
LVKFAVHMMWLKSKLLLYNILEEVHYYYYVIIIIIIIIIIINFISALFIWSETRNCKCFDSSESGGFYMGVPSKFTWK